MFTRDIIAAVNELNNDKEKYHISAVIIAQNWSVSELEHIAKQMDLIFHFDMNPNQFDGFDEKTQVRLNKYIEGLLNE